jgi:hypothetical protein
VWHAQIEVLFPLVELVRIELARLYGSLLKDVPDEETGGYCEPQDVEVGPLAHRLVAAARCVDHIETSPFVMFGERWRTSSRCLGR